MRCIRVYVLTNASVMEVGICCELLNVCVFFYR